MANIQELAAQEVEEFKSEYDHPDDVDETLIAEAVDYAINVMPFHECIEILSQDYSIGSIDVEVSDTTVTPFDVLKLAIYIELEAKIRDAMDEWRNELEEDEEEDF